MEKKTFFFFLICSRLKIKYILFETKYPDINISVLVYCVVGRQTHSVKQVSEIFAERIWLFQKMSKPFPAIQKKK